MLQQLALQSQTLTNLQAAIAELQEWLAELLGELKERADGDRERLLAVERVQLVCGNAVRQRLGGLEKGAVPDLDERVGEIEKLVPALRVMTWIGALLGASIIALVWALITGQAQVVFP